MTPEQELLQLPRKIWTPALNEQGVIPAHVTMESPLKKVRVTARGHIVVEQECYESTLTSQLGSVFVLYGATRQSTFSAAMNVFVKHAEDAELTAGRDIVIEDSVRNSRLTAGRKIISESDRGRAIGGSLTAEQSIELHALGSPAEIATEVVVTADNGFVVCRGIHPGVSMTIGGVKRLFRTQGESGAYFRRINQQDGQLYMSAVTRETSGDEIRYIPVGRPEVLLNH